MSISASKTFAEPQKSTGPRALISGVNGQDGFYLAELLLRKGYQVVGIARQNSSTGLATLPDAQVAIRYDDLRSEDAWLRLIRDVAPREIYHLASQSAPNRSWSEAVRTLEDNAVVSAALFSAAQREKTQSRIFFASSAEIFGGAGPGRHDEATRIQPLNPYAVSKACAHQLAALYREAHGLFVASGILFNHESPRHSLRFVMQKITYAAACIRAGLCDSPECDELGAPILKNGTLSLGNLSARRDWGYAKDYVDAMWHMLQLDTAQDFVIGTGVAHSVEDICREAFGYVGADWTRHVHVEQRLLRPLDTEVAVADPRKANEILGWQPKTTFEQLVRLLVDHHQTRLTGTSAPRAGARHP